VPLDVRPDPPARRARRAFPAGDPDRAAELRRLLAKSQRKRQILRLRVGKQPVPA